MGGSLKICQSTEAVNGANRIATTGEKILLTSDKMGKKYRLPTWTDIIFFQKRRATTYFINFIEKTEVKNRTFLSKAQFRRRASAVPN